MRQTVSVVVKLKASNQSTELFWYTFAGILKTRIVQDFSDYVIKFTAFTPYLEDF